MNVLSVPNIIIARLHDTLRFDEKARVSCQVCAMTFTTRIGEAKAERISCAFNTVARFHPRCRSRKWLLTVSNAMWVTKL